MNNNNQKNPRQRPQRTVKRRPMQPQAHPQGSYTSNFTIFSIIIICLLSLVVIKVFSGIVIKNPEVVIRPEGAIAEEKAREDAEKALKKKIAKEFDKVHAVFDDTRVGNLILVNNDNAYAFDSSPSLIQKKELVSIYSKKTKDYVVSYNTETMTEEAILSFNDLAADFAAATGKKDLIIIDSIRTQEDQIRLYEEKGPSIATKPGYSEHHTGLAFDISIYKKGNFDGTGDYAWIAENCHKYGYILRYAENKTELTGISYEPWHFRYVGIEHATYIKENDLCLEEYIETILPNYTLEGTRLNITTHDGAVYEIFTQPVGEAGNEIYVPKEGQYSLSGDNKGRIVVSRKLSDGVISDIQDIPVEQ